MLRKKIPPRTSWSALTLDWTERRGGRERRLVKGTRPSISSECVLYFLKPSSSYKGLLRHNYSYNQLVLNWAATELRYFDSYFSKAQNFLKVMGITLQSQRTPSMLEYTRRKHGWLKLGMFDSYFSRRHSRSLATSVKVWLTNHWLHSGFLDKDS